MVSVIARVGGEAASNSLSWQGVRGEVFLVLHVDTICGYGEVRPHGTVGHVYPVDFPVGRGIGGDDRVATAASPEPPSAWSFPGSLRE